MSSPFDSAPTYAPRANSSIRDLILMGGEQRARAAEQAGQIWGNFANQVGGIASNALMQHAGQQQEKKEQAQMAARDAATAQAIDSWTGDPKELFSNLVKIRGPKEGAQMAETIAKFSRNSADENPESHLKTTHAALGMFLKETPELQAATWGRFKAGLDPTIAKLKLPVQLGDALDENTVAQLTAAHGALGEIVGAKPAEAKKVGTHVVGGNLVDDEGKVLFAAPEKPEKPTKLEHVDLGDSVGILDPTTGEVIKRIPRGLAPARPDKPDKAPTLKPLTQGEVKGVTEIDTGLADAALLKKDLSEAGSTGGGSAFGASLPNFVTELTGWGSDSKKQQAVINRVKQVIGKAMEGGVLRKEDEEKYKQILPTIGDPPDIAQSKINGLLAALEEKRAITLENLEATGRDVARLKSRTAPSAAPAAPATGPRIGERRSIKGVMAEWDGKGWKRAK